MILLDHQTGTSTQFAIAGHPQEITAYALSDGVSIVFEQLLLDSDCPIALCYDPCDPCNTVQNDYTFKVIASTPVTDCCGPVVLTNKRNKAILSSNGTYRLSIAGGSINDGLVDMQAFKGKQQPCKCP